MSAPDLSIEAFTARLTCLVRQHGRGSVKEALKDLNVRYRPTKANPRSSAQVSMNWLTSVMFDELWGLDIEVDGVPEVAWRALSLAEIRLYEKQLT